MSEITSVKIMDVKAMDDYRLLITFDGNEQRIFDMKPRLGHPFYKELNEFSYFSQVKIDPFTGDTVTWPHEQDIAPHELYEASVPVAGGA